MSSPTSLDTTSTSKKCARCGETKLLSEFNKNREHRDGLAAWCRPCNSVNCKQWAKENPTQKRLRTRESHLRKQYGIGLEDYARMLEEHGGVCAICFETCQKGGYLSVDHDHNTGKIRGLVCDFCNNGLGRFRDSSKILRSAAIYLEEHGSAH